MPPGNMILQFGVLCKLSATIYTYHNTLLLIGHIYFYQGILFSNTFIRFLDYCTFCSDENYQLFVKVSIVLSQCVPKFNRHCQIQDSCFGSMFYVRLSIIMKRALRATVTTQKSYVLQSLRIYTMEPTRMSLQPPLNQSSANRLTIIPKQ